MGDTQSEKESLHRAAHQTEFGRVQRTSNRELSIENEDLDAGRPSVSRRDVPGDESRLGAVYVWGDEFAPGRRMMANTWQGEFPWQNLLTDGYEGTSPSGCDGPGPSASLLL